MGIDLRLLPCEFWKMREGRLWGYSHTILDLGRVSHEAHDAFQTMVKPHLAPLPVDHDVTSFVGRLVPDGSCAGERLYGHFRATDAYGEAYKVVDTCHLLPWLEEHFRHDGSNGYGPYQVAICAYLRALPRDTKIVLDWH